MEKLCVVVSCLLLTVTASSAQEDSVKPLERPLPQWLTGIIAVAGFLFLSFVVFLVKKAWCSNSDGRNSSTEERVTRVTMAEESSYETSLDLGRRNTEGKENTYENSVDLIRNKDEVNSYYNEGFDSSEEKVTSM